MNKRAILRPGAVAVAALFIAAPAAIAQPSPSPLAAAEVAGALRGKTCVSRIGAKFVFSRDGHYAYDGLWTSSGHYSVHDGAVNVLFDSGLQRDFAISRRDGVMRIEETVLTCATRSASGRSARAAVAPPSGHLAAAR